MNAGELRSRITIRKPVKSRVRGDSKTTWTDVDTVWGSIRPLRGREIFIGGQQQGEATHEIRMRWRADVAAHNEWRLRYANRNFDIQNTINFEESNNELLIECMERVRGD